jgi:hypothetical protein
MSKLDLICRMVGQKEWWIVSNPIWKEPHAEYYAAQILKSCPVEYVEYVNTGAVYRVVRRYTLPAYGRIDPSPDIPF